MGDRASEIARLPLPYAYCRNAYARYGGRPAFTLAAKAAGLDRLPISISTTSEVFDVLLFLFSFFLYSLGAGADVC